MNSKNPISNNKLLVSTSLFLLSVGLVSLFSVAKYLFPSYFLYVGLALLAFLFFTKFEYEILAIFSSHLYIVSIILLLIPLILGEVTRGTVRWIPIGSFQLQPSEIVRPFLFLFWANYLIEKPINTRRFINFSILLALPIILIVIAPSLGVAVLTSVGALGVIISSAIPKKYIVMGFVLILTVIPIFWYILAPYQKQRVLTFLDPQKDPRGAGYNSIQAMISVGSGKIFGRGLGEGVQTQLLFLPERHTDFIFASIAEEMGFAGSLFLVLLFLLFFWGISKVIAEPVSPSSRAFASGVFLSLFAETFIHIGMNMGLLPITGVPLPLVSAGGSSLLATAIFIALLLKAKKA